MLSVSWLAVPVNDQPFAAPLKTSAPPLALTWLFCTPDTSMPFAVRLAPVISKVSVPVVPAKASPDRSAPVTSVNVNIVSVNSLRLLVNDQPDAVPLNTSAPPPALISLFSTFWISIPFAESAVPSTSNVSEPAAPVSVPFVPEVLLRSRI